MHDRAGAWGKAIALSPCAREKCNPKGTRRSGSAGVNTHFAGNRDSDVFLIGSHTFIAEAAPIKKGPPVRTGEPFFFTLSVGRHAPPHRLWESKGCPLDWSYPHIYDDYAPTMIMVRTALFATFIHLFRQEPAGYPQGEREGRETRGRLRMHFLALQVTLCGHTGYVYGHIRIRQFFGSFHSFQQLSAARNIHMSNRAAAWLRLREYFRKVFCNTLRPFKLGACEHIYLIPFLALW